MSRLLLIRHAEAGAAIPDEARELTARGRKQSEALGRFLASQVKKPGAIWHSSLVRARQTAELIAGAAGWPSTMQERSGLRPGDDPRVLKIQLPPEGDLVVVGHNPFLESLAAWLVVRELHAPVFHFRKSACLCLERVDDSWSVAWMLAPEVVPG
jgi:phosphohistidine phosphatase